MTVLSEGRICRFQKVGGGHATSWVSSRRICGILILGFQSSDKRLQYIPIIVNTDNYPAERFGAFRPAMMLKKPSFFSFEQQSHVFLGHIFSACKAKRSEAHSVDCGSPAVV